jgi:DedD protein
MKRDEANDTGSVRNLDDIQEDDPGVRPSRASALVLASLGGACIVLAAALLMRAPPKIKPVSADPLGDLVARAHPAGAAADTDTIGQEVTFPTLLSDAKRPTTAFEAIKDGRPDGVPLPGSGPAIPSAPLPFALAPGAPTTPPTAADRLPVVPLPAQEVLQVGPGPGGEAAQGDTLTAMARHVSRDDGAEMAPAGSAGGFQLQVSSFKTPPEAEAFAAALRRRGHKAYVEPAQVKGRGT